MNPRGMKRLQLQRAACGWAPLAVPWGATCSFCRTGLGALSCDAGTLLSYGGPELFPGTRACSSGSTPVDCPSTLTYRGLSSCTGEGFRGGQGSRRRTRVAKEDSVSDLGPPAQLWPRKRPQQAGGDLPKYTSLAVRRRSRADWAAVAAHVCRGARRCSATRGSALPWTAGLTAKMMDSTAVATHRTSSD